MSDIKFVYFDVGGVVVLDFSQTNKLQLLMDDLEVPHDIRADFDRVFRNEHELSAGVWDQEETKRRIEEATGFRFPKGYDLYQDFVNRFDRNTDLLKLVEDLQVADYKVGLLTNMWEGMLQKIYALDLIPTETWDVVVDSWEAQSAKPHREIYELAQRRTEVKPEEILFIDNKQENLDAAERLGWYTYLYNPSEPDKHTKKIREILLG